MAAELPVVHFQIRHRSATLTPPPVATQDLPYTFSLLRSPPQHLKLGAQLLNPLLTVSPFLSCENGMQNQCFQALVEQVHKF